MIRHIKYGYTMLYIIISAQCPKQSCGVNIAPSPMDGQAPLRNDLHLKVLEPECLTKGDVCENLFKHLSCPATL